MVKKRFSNKIEKSLIKYKTFICFRFYCITFCYYLNLIDIKIKILYNYKLYIPTAYLSIHYHHHAFILIYPIVRIVYLIRCCNIQYKSILAVIVLLKKQRDEGQTSSIIVN